MILAGAAVAVAPQMVWGNSCGHDFDFHLVSWFDCLNSWRHGLLYPHWAPSANFGAGEPRFVFYPPLTWMLGAALALALPWTLVPVALTFLLLAGTGLATRALARQALGEGAATLAGCAALFSGYALFTAYERSAFGELAGGLWIPLVLLFALRDRAATVPAEAGRSSPGSAWRRAFDGSAAPLALVVAGAWLSNPTVGVMSCYLLAAVALALALLDRSWAPVLRASAGAVVGMGLIAIYLLPAAWEQRWVDIRQFTDDPGEALENSWLFAVHADPELALHDQVLRTASLIAVVMIAMALAGLLVSWLRGRLPGARRWWIPLALIPAAVLMLQFPFSRPVWNLLPELRFLQFPWRWLVAVEAPMGIFAAAAVWPGEGARRWRRVAVESSCVAVFVAMTTLAGRTYFQNCDDEDAVTAMLDTYRSGQGFTGTGEYEPIGADDSLVATGLPAACLVSNPATLLGIAAGTPDTPPEWEPGQGSCEATYAEAATARPEHLRMVATTPQPGYLILRLRSYPAWSVKVNGRPAIGLPQRDDGLMAVPVPQGPVDLTADWTTTPDVTLGRWLSGLSVLALTGLCLLERRLSRARL